MHTHCFALPIAGRLFCKYKKVSLCLCCQPYALQLVARCQLYLTKPFEQLAKMKRQLYLRWLLLLLATFLLDNVTGHSASDKACGRPGIALPIEKMAQGVDITELELFPMAMEVKSRPPLFAFTCNGNRKFTHPDNETRVFNLPDQFDRVYPVSSDDSFSIGTTLFRHSRSFKMPRMQRAKLNLNLPWYGAFSQNARLRDLQRTLYREKKSVGEVSGRARMRSKLVNTRLTRSLLLLWGILLLLPVPLATL